MSELPTAKTYCRVSRVRLAPANRTAFFHHGNVGASRPKSKTEGHEVATFAATSEGELAPVAPLTCTDQLGRTQLAGADERNFKLPENDPGEQDEVHHERHDHEAPDVLSVSLIPDILQYFRSASTRPRTSPLRDAWPRRRFTAHCLGGRSLRDTLNGSLKDPSVMADLPAKNSIWRIMPPRARLVVTILGVIGILGIIVEFAVDNTWLAAVALAALVGAVVIAYSSARGPRSAPPCEPGTPIP